MFDHCSESHPDEVFNKNNFLSFFKKIFNETYPHVSVAKKRTQEAKIKCIFLCSLVGWLSFDISHVQQNLLVAMKVNENDQKFRLGKS